MHCLLPQLAGAEGAAHEWPGSDGAKAEVAGCGGPVVKLFGSDEAIDRQTDEGLTVWISSDGRFPYASTRGSLLPTGFFEDAVRIRQGVANQEDNRAHSFMLRTAVLYLSSKAAGQNSYA